MQHLRVQNVGQAHQQEDQHLPADAAEANRGTELPVTHRAHHPGEVVNDHKHQQRVQQTVASAEEVPEPSAHRGKHKLNHMPEIFQAVNPPINIKDYSMNCYFHGNRI